MVEKSWVHLHRADPGYERGAREFVRSVYSANGVIICPCIDCRNVDRHSVDVVVDHLVTRGMDWSYKMRKDWYHHGEVTSGTECRSNDSQHNQEILALYQAAELQDEELVRQGDITEVAEGEDKQEDEFLAKLADAETPLYPSCENHSKLSAIVSLFRLKTQSGWSDRSFDLLLETLPQMLPKDNVLHTSFPSTSSKNKCKLMDYFKSDEVVAVGRWQSQEPKALVNGLPLGPKAFKVFVDEVINPAAYLWRPTIDMRTVGDSLNHFVAWPGNRVVLETTNTPSPDPSSYKSATTSSQNEKSPVASTHRTTSQRNTFKENQKCKLLDLSGKKLVVAEGRWSSNNPDQVVHFVPLGHGACRVWVDVVKVKDAAVWRQSSEIEYMEDALGSCIAWPEDKVVME